MSCHFYDGTQRGRSKLSIQELTWSKDGWPTVTDTADRERETVHDDRLPIEWIDPKTGHRIVRLSKQAGSASLYFHQNAFSPEGDKIVIFTPRGLETVDLRTRELNVVVPQQNYRTDPAYFKGRPVLSKLS